jgi:hypothetical protein
VPWLEAQEQTHLLQRGGRGLEGAEDAHRGGLHVDGGGKRQGSWCRPRERAVNVSGGRGRSTHSDATGLGDEALGAWIEISAPVAPPTAVGAEAAVKTEAHAAPVVRAAGSGAKWGPSP